MEGDGLSLGTADEAINLRFVQTTAVEALSELLNKELKLTRFTDSGRQVALPSTVAITLLFRDNGQATGRSSVNSYGGAYTATSDGKITIRNLISTQMAGPQELMDLEKTYFDALTRVTQVVVSRDRVVLSDDSTVLEFAVGAAH